MSSLLDPFELERKVMVETQLRARGISNERVLDAMLKVPRELFIPDARRHTAYWDCPVPIGLGQTISQPYIVALMTEQARIHSLDWVLEVGTGSGYQTAILAELAAQVCTLELIPDLADRSRNLLDRLGYRNINFAVGDGYNGWPESIKFDAIIVTAAPPTAPEKLMGHLTDGGRMIIPIGEDFQELFCIENRQHNLFWHEICQVRFVPMQHHEGDQKNASSSV